jgi:hypothetical protein
MNVYHVGKSAGKAASSPGLRQEASQPGPEMWNQESRKMTPKARKADAQLARQSKRNGQANSAEMSVSMILSPAAAVHGVRAS